VLTNAYPIGVPEALSKSFLELVLHGKITQDWVDAFGALFARAFTPEYGTAVNYDTPPVQISPALDTQSYVGTYHHDFFGDLTIVARDGGLILQLGPHKTPFPLRHYARDVFTYQPAGENAAGLSAVTFTVDTMGQAQRVVIENLDIHGDGTFTRLPTLR
jgi:hypothetical protein